MFGRWSSKRKSTAIPPHPGPDADGVSRVIPKEIWDGPHGDFLREIGVSPDDPSNLMPTQEGVQARFNELRGELDAFVASVNGKLPDGAKVIPWAMIPWSVWSKQHADFLVVVCELYPVGSWNTMLLPEDDRSASILGMPKHFQAVPPGLEDAANRLIGEIREEFAKTQGSTQAALADGDFSSLDEHAKAKNELVANMRGLAHFLGSHTYGEDAYARHRDVFGAMLGWVPAKG